MSYEEVIDVLRKTLPPVFKRTDVGKLTGGVVNPNYLRTMPKKYPKPKSVRMGAFAVFIKEDFIEWMEKYYGQFESAKPDGFPGQQIRRATVDAGEAGEYGEEGED